MQSTLEHWGFALPAGRPGQCSRPAQPTQQSTKIAPGNELGSAPASSSNSKAPARMYYNKVKNTKYSNEAYIGKGDNTFQNSSNQQSKISKKPRICTYGDEIAQKQDGICRIVSHNINCIGVDTFYNSKLHNIKEWLYQQEVDICGWQEVGVAQHMLQRHEKLSERMRDIRRTNIRMCSSNNKHETIDRFQYGGTAIFAFDYMSHMVRGSGVDPTELGRWSWLQLEGHKSRRVRVISAYNPCRTSFQHFATVYSQHKRYFNSKHCDACPRKQFCRDLCAFITECQNEGEEIVLLIDTNENLSQMHHLQQHLTSYPLSLLDPIRLRHGNLNSPPPTTDRGSYPIDSVFVSPRLADIHAGGWLQLSNGFSDHRPLFIDISIKKLLGRYKNTTSPYTMRHLKCNDPRAVQKYNELLAKQYQSQNTEPFF